MKIYFAINEEKFPNPFVSILAKRLKEIDPDVEIAMGISTFWGDEIFSCNIVHIHWPEILLREANKRTGLKKSRNTVEKLWSHATTLPPIMQNFNGKKKPTLSFTT